MTNFEKTVAAMSPQDMELLIRAYVRRHIRSVGVGYEDQVYFRLSGVTVREGRNLDPIKWHLTNSGSDTAEGEVLAVVAEEFYRRKGWTASNAAGLLLLEGSRAEEVAT